MPAIIELDNHNKKQSSQSNVLDWELFALTKMVDNAIKMGDIETFTTLESLIMLRESSIIKIKWENGEPIFQISEEIDDIEKAISDLE